MTRKPPYPARLLLRLIPAPHREFIEGDLEEEFESRAARSPLRAAAWYWRQVLATLPCFGRHMIERFTTALTPAELERRILAMAAHLGIPTDAAPARTPAFGSRLIASKPPREGMLATSFGSVLFHVATFGGLVYGTVGNHVEAPPVDVKIIETYQDMVVEKPAPPPPAEAGAPVETDIPDFVVPTEIPIEIPPPGAVSITSDDIIQRIIEAARDSTPERGSDVVALGERPTFTPFEVAPRMKNRPEVARALEREYPALLRDAGIGGTVEVWFYLDEAGVVQNVQVNASSGQPSLDEAALRVARVAEFSAAQNRDKPVPVWVKLPITFEAR